MLRRHTFDFLRGDSTPKRPHGVMLPVDAYFPAHDLVLEFMGPQHFLGNPLMDRRAGRKEQRARYQERRTIVLAQHKIRLIRVRFDEPLSDELVHEKLRAVGIRA